jgi:hypothetical protein
MMVWLCWCCGRPRVCRPGAIYRDIEVLASQTLHDLALGIVAS